jgi:uncharacterized protein (DUF169 family)
MGLTEQDFAVLDDFKFDIQPVGVKFLVKPLEKVDKLDSSMTLCEMLKKAQEGDTFYAGPENHTCGAGPYLLGQTELEGPFRTGEFGAGLGVFKDTRAASRLYLYVQKIARGVVNYIALSPLSKLPFEPDVMIFLAKTSQAEILLRAMSYKTGKMWTSRYSSAIGCSWLFIYPYLSGEINFIPTGLGFGMRRRKLFPEGLIFLSIPFDQMPSLLQTLREMPWVPEPYKPDGVEYVKQLLEKLGVA